MHSCSIGREIYFGEQCNVVLTLDSVPILNLSARSRLFPNSGKGGLFTLVPSENRTRAQCSDTKCEPSQMHGEMKLSREFFCGDLWR